MISELIKWISSRTLFSYLICFCFILPFLNVDKLFKNAIAQTMSRYVPPIEYFKEFDSNPLNLNEYKLNWCVDYHLRVARYFNYQSAEAYAMAAYCSYRLGEVSLAKEYYERSLKFNSEYFWTFYNLGLINYLQSNYSMAATILKESLSKDIKMNLFMVLQSKVYLDVLNSDGLRMDIHKRFRDGFLDSYIMMLQSLWKLKEYDLIMDLSKNAIQQNLGPADIFYFYMGKSLLAMGVVDKALNCFNIALQINPINKDAQNYLGKLDKNEQINSETEDYIVQEVLRKGVRFF